MLGDSGICRNRTDPGSYVTVTQGRERRKELRKFQPMLINSFKRCFFEPLVYSGNMIDAQKTFHSVMNVD